MTERITYAEGYIGECIVGSCGRPATVRVHEDFVLCAHHYLQYEISSDELDEVTLALELIKGWRSVADMHDNDILQEMFRRAEFDLKARAERAERYVDQLERIEYEAEEGQSLRTMLGGQAGKSAQEEAGALPELSAFGRQLVALTKYPGEDLTRLARDMVRTAGCEADTPDAGEMVKALESRMRSSEAPALPEEFVRALAEGLHLSGPERAGFAESYTLDEFAQPDQESRPDALTAANSLLSEASTLLSESAPLTEEEEEAEREAKHAIADAGRIIAKELRRRSRGAPGAAGSDEPENGGRASA